MFAFFTFALFCCSIEKLRLTLWDPMDYSMLGFPVFHRLPELAQTRIHWVGDVIQPSHTLSPLHLLPSIFCRIRVFSNESALCIRQPNYWSFSFSINPSNEYSELISCRIHRFDLAVQGNPRVFSTTTVWDHQFFSAQPFLFSSTHILTWLLEKP